jgi:hypothetical protein
VGEVVRQRWNQIHVAAGKRRHCRRIVRKTRRRNPGIRAQHRNRNRAAKVRVECRAITMIICSRVLGLFGVDAAAQHARCSDPRQRGCAIRCMGSAA